MRPSLIEKPAPFPFVAKSRAAMGKKAAEDIAYELSRRLQDQQGVRMIFAAAPSQSETLSALMLMPVVDWSRVTAFHMDEYLGLPSEAPQRFGLWLRRAIFDRLPFAAVHLLEPGTDPEAPAAEYADRLAASPIDIVCCGIGSNGHLAFNDPPADLNDPSDVNVVTLDTACRQQQVDDNKSTIAVSSASTTSLPMRSHSRFHGCSQPTASSAVSPALSRKLPYAAPCRIQSAA